MSEKIKIGIIGCGWISDSHIKGYANDERVKMVSFCDTDVARAIEKAGKFDAKYYTDYREMLSNEELDGVSVCTFANIHRDIVIEAFNNGVNVLCEKPLASNVEDAQEMVKMGGKSNLILMAAFVYRFHEAVIKAKQLIEEGKLGKILMFRSRFAREFKGGGRTWFGKREPGGGGNLVDSSIHSVDIFRFVIGEIENVSARVSTYHSDFEVEDSGAILVQSTDGVIGCFEASWVTPISESVIEIYGSQGSIIIDYTFPSAGLMDFKSTEVKYKTKGSNSWTKVELIGSDPFELETKHFVDCIANKKEPLVTGKDGLMALKVIKEAYRSIEEKRWIDLTF
jgi:UDP-N-acetylglucosamine 3-dehydrogenase